VKSLVNGDVRKSRSIEASGLTSLGLLQRTTFQIIGLSRSVLGEHITVGDRMPVSKMAFR